MTFVISAILAGINAGVTGGHYHSTKVGFAVLVASFLLFLAVYYAVTRRRVQPSEG